MDESSGGSPEQNTTGRITKVTTSLWFLWLVITLGNILTLGNSREPGTWNFVINPWFDLFTPILVFNWSVVTVLIVLAGLVAGHLLTSRLSSAPVRILCNLLILFGLTCTTDLIMRGRPISLYKLLAHLSGHAA